MRTDLDREGLIVSLTEGVGVQFGQASRRSFFQQLERMEGQPGFRKSPPEAQQFFIDLLAFASFYQCVIVPINSSAEFVSVLHTAGATHLRVAGDKLDEKYAARAGAVASGFREILKRAVIPDHLLHYATLKEFIHNAQRFFHERQS